MSSTFLRAALFIAIAVGSAAAGMLACGGEHTSSVPAGGPIVVPSAHPSPDPRPAIPLSITKDDAGGGAGGGDADAGP